MEGKKGRGSESEKEGKEGIRGEGEDGKWKV